MKAADAHLPINMMVYVRIPARFIIIATPDLFEWVPASAAVKPRDVFSYGSYHCGSDVM